MKKIVMVLVCLMTMVMCVSCGNVEEDMKAAMNRFGMFSESFADRNGSFMADKLWDTLMANTKGHKKVLKSDSIIGLVVADADLVVRKSFDGVFEKYGERKTLEAFVRYASERTYDNITVNDKEELYIRLKAALMEMCKKVRDKKVDEKMMEYKLEKLAKF